MAFNNWHSNRGLTLIEVMVAMMIIALVMVGVIVGGTHVMSSAQRIQDRTLAMWVADTAAVELRAGLWGEVGEQGSFEGTQILGDKTWHWIAKSYPCYPIICIDLNVFDAKQKAPLYEVKVYTVAHE